MKWASSSDSVTDASYYGTVFTGSDIGFQRVADELGGLTPDGKIVGRVVVKVSGQWVEIGRGSFRWTYSGRRRR